VSALSEVDSARVHVTYPKESVFAENRLPAKASVMVRLKTGRALDEQSVAAVRFLVASAVEGLAPEAVSVLDMDGRVLGKPKERHPDDPSMASDAALEYRLRIEKEMLARMNETLEAIVGADRYRASVFVDCDLTRGEQSEESFDPNKSVMTQSERVKESSSANTPAGVPGTASNLPRPVATQSRGSGYTRESENVTYQSAHTIRRIRLPEGRIVRISASVLVDQDLEWTRQGDGYRRVLTPPSADMLRRIRELVSGAIGVDETRGDRLVVDTLPFDSTLKRQPPAVVKPPLSPWERVRRESPALWIPVVAVAAVLIAVVVFLMIRRRRRPAPVTAPVLAAQLEGEPALFDDALPAPADSELDEAANDLKRRIEGTRRKRALEKQQLQAAGALAEEVLQELRDSASTDPGLCAGALRIWLTDAEPVRVERHGK
jgi:flagellar M-ring protein FliF